MSSQILDVPAKHAFSIAGFLDKAWNSLAETTMQTGWAPLTRLSQIAVISLMRKITVGQLRVVTPEDVYTFPQQDSLSAVENAKPELQAELRVVSDTFWVRLCAMGDLGFSEAYMYGEVQCDDLLSLFQIFLDNKENLENMDSRFSFLFSLPQKITSYRFLNTIGNSRSNISAHYDISNAMFAGFLSQDMTYSCAIFSDLDGDLKEKPADYQCNGIQGLKALRNNGAEKSNGYSDDHPHHANGNGVTNGHANGNCINGHAHGNRNGIANGHPKVNGHTSNGHALSGDPGEDELYEAQVRKLDHIIQKAKIRPGHRVLEIGSGWGSMAIRITQNIPGTTVDTLTLSVQQQALAEKRISAAGLSDRITVHLMDYRNMPPEWEGLFDRVVSVEMLEAVGEEFLETYWRIVEWALKPRTGAGVVQVITLPESRWDRYRTEVDFIRKWAIFPGGCLPPVTLLLDTLRSGSKNRLIVDSVSNIGPHYARTLREWRRRFLDRFEDVIVPALGEEYPSVMGPTCGEQGRKEIEVFKKKWIYYYCYCEIAFTTRTIGDHIITFAREGYQDFGCDVFV